MICALINSGEDTQRPHIEKVKEVVAEIRVM